MIATLRRRRDDEGGFALIFVLFVSTMIMIGTATMLTLVTSNIGPAKSSQDGYAALAAARSGVQDYLAQLNANCRSLSVQACSWVTSHQSMAATIGDETYTVRALNAANYVSSNDNTLRVVATGNVGGVAKTMTADLSSTPSVLRFTYFSNYETLGTTFLRAYYSSRDVVVTDPAAASAAGLTVGSKVHWNGTGAAPSNGYTDTVCDALYYDDPSNPAALTGQGRSNVEANRNALAPGTDFSEGGYTQTAVAGVVLPTTTMAPQTRDAPCEVRFSKGMTFTGPVYSRDALYLTNGEVSSTVGGPAFNVPSTEPLPPASTAWSAGATPANDTGTPYRVDSQLPAAPTTTSGRAPVGILPSTLTLPSTVDPDATCTYTGPTRIVLNGSTATISSPSTPPVSTDPCYQANGSGTGVVNSAVPVGSTTIRIVNGAGTETFTPPTFPGLALGSNGDVTPYSSVLGDAYVEGNLSAGKLSLVADDDIVVTGDLTTTRTTGTNSGSGERAWTGGAAIDLVATRNVRVYHPVACKDQVAADLRATTAGYCPNDITGLYSLTPDSTHSPVSVVAKSDGTLKATHPSKQYTDISIARPGRIDAAIMALNGSFLTDNFDRGNSLGNLVVNGGVYMNHRGALGQLWEVPTTAISSSRPSSGYSLQLSYLDYSKAGLPFVPVLDDSGNPATPWKIYNVSTGGTP